MSDHILGLMTTQIWQIAALAIIVAFVVKLAAKNRPHLAHALWMLVLIKCLIPPLWGHSLGVFSQLQAQLLPDPEHGQPETYEPDELLSLADTEPPEDASFMWDGGTNIERDELQSLSIEGDESVQTLDEIDANIAKAEPALPVESVESDANSLRHGWLLLSGLVAGAMMTMCIMVYDKVMLLCPYHQVASRQAAKSRPAGGTYQNCSPAGRTYIISIPSSRTNCSTSVEATCAPARCRRLRRVCGGFIRPCGYQTAGCRERPNDAATSKSSLNSAVHPPGTPAACCPSLNANTNCNRSPSSPA